MLRPAAAALLLVLAALVAFGAPRSARSADPPPAELRERARKALGKEMQARLPEDDPVIAKRPLPPPRQVRDGEDRRVRVSGEGSVIGSFFMWIIIGVVGVLIVLFLYNEFAGYERVAKDAAAPGGADDDGTAAVVERPLGDAEQLAAAGRYGEAIHVLLLRTFEELMRRLDRPVPPSKTSREILAETQLDPDSHGALAHLVSAVEISFFGGAEPGADEYRLCVERFRRFATAYRGARA